MATDTTSTYELQTWNWATHTWDQHAVYTGESAEGNAHHGAQLQRASRTGPIRLLRDGAVISADDPATYYDDED